MKLAHSKQKFQDWFTQQWVILFGKLIEPKTTPWLMGPFGKTGAIADDFVNTIAKEQGLIIRRNATTHGLIPSVKELNLSDEASNRLSLEVINFYEKTSLYKLNFSVKWNPLFNIFGRLTNYLFSTRINQLNIPTNNVDSYKEIDSEIITLSDPQTEEVKYTVWYRTFKSTGKVLYSGIYTTCTLPSGKTCIKATFPLPYGNATVIMNSSVGPNGELHLNSSGEKFGDPGFYFLLNDSKGNVWSKYIKSFRDHLVVRNTEGRLTAKQTLTLWHCDVLNFNYEIQYKDNEQQ